MSRVPVVAGANGAAAFPSQGMGPGSGLRGRWRGAAAPSSWASSPPPKRPTSPGPLPRRRRSRLTAVQPAMCRAARRKTRRRTCPAGAPLVPLELIASSYPQRQGLAAANGAAAAPPSCANGGGATIGRAGCLGQPCRATTRGSRPTRAGQWASSSQAARRWETGRLRKWSKHQVPPEPGHQVEGSGPGSLTLPDCGCKAHRGSSSGGRWDSAAAWAALRRPCAGRASPGAPRAAQPRRPSVAPATCEQKEARWPTSLRFAASAASVAV